MNAALKFLTRITDEFFASQMQRAAVKITARHDMFARRVR